VAAPLHNQTAHPKRPVIRQCERLGLARTDYDFQPQPESEENIRLVQVVDETYLACPFFPRARWQLVAASAEPSGKHPPIQAGRIFEPPPIS